LHNTTQEVNTHQHGENKLSRYLLLTPFKKPNGEIKMEMSISKNLRPQHWQTVSTILDFKNKRVERAKINDVPTTNWNEVLLNLYPTHSGIIDMLCQVNKCELPVDLLPMKPISDIDKASLMTAIEDADRRAGIIKPDPAPE